MLLVCYQLRCGTGDSVGPGSEGEFADIAFQVNCKFLIFLFECKTEHVVSCVSFFMSVSVLFNLIVFSL